MTSTQFKRLSKGQAQASTKRKKAVVKQDGLGLKIMAIRSSDGPSDTENINYGVENALKTVMYAS